MSYSTGDASAFGDADSEGDMADNQCSPTPLLTASASS
jgi:hypothetical protein